MDSQDGGGSDLDGLNLSLSKSTSQGSGPGWRGAPMSRGWAGGAGGGSSDGVGDGAAHAGVLPSQRYSPVAGALAGDQVRVEGGGGL